MQTRQHFVDDYRAAMQREQDLWVQVKGHGPGQQGFNQALWDQWMEAVSKTNAASRAMREAFSGSGKPGEP
jgi:hypothetical protein